MDWLFKAGLTAAMVLLVLEVARRSGHRWAGMAAALPTITAPTLAWLAHERGLAFAVDAAVASISACAMLAVFSLGYALAARRRGRACALACGGGAALVLAWPAFATSTCLARAMLLGLGCSALALWCMPRQAVPSATRAHPARAALGTALVAGSVTALAVTLGPALGGFATGALASAPVISAAAAMVAHTQGGHGAVASFLRGYAWGLFGKAGFAIAFVLLAPHTGAALGLLLACACTALTCLVPPPRCLAAHPLRQVS